jgi:hypothetical protein
MSYKKGKDKVGRPLEEDTLPCGVVVLWRNKRYQTGNRRHRLVELLNNRGELVRITSMAYVTIAPA